MILSLSTTAFLNDGLINSAFADSNEDETFYGEILRINPQRRHVTVIDNRTSEEYGFRVFKSSLLKISLGDQVRIDYSPYNGLFNMYKIVNEGKREKLVRIE